MSEPVLQVTNLSKIYREYNSEFARVFSWFGAASKPATEHCVLNGISFSLMPGEAVGIVGQNGAGKSTLLKLITGTLKPSTGEVRAAGRIAAILELGMGFNPEFTGRQNVYHSAGLMGFTRHQIDQVIPQIEDFAEIGDYFDEPVNIYSSGMQLRVAFSVITAFRPEILIVDEALSVGDAYFQHKSFARIREFQELGTTLLVVSHDRGAIQSLCDRAILLEKGLIIKDSDPETVMDYYNALIAEKENNIIRVEKLGSGKNQTVSGTREITLTDIALLDDQDKPLRIVKVGQRVSLCVFVKAQTYVPELVIGYMIKDRLGMPIFGTNTYHLKHPLSDICKGEKIQLSFRFLASLGPGSYSIAVALHAGETHTVKNYEWRDLALTFNVINVNKDQFLGVGWLPPVVESIR